MVRKYMVWLLIGLFSLVELFSYADIIYLELDSSEDSDIVYLKNGRQIKGRVVERSPQQVKIEVISESKKNVSNDEIVYGVDEVEKVEVRLPKKKVSIFWKIAKGCLWAYVGLMVIGLAMAPGP